MKENEFNVYKIRYSMGGTYTISVVTAETAEEAFKMLIDLHDIKRSNIEEWEEITEKDIVLSWFHIG